MIPAYSQSKVTFIYFGTFLFVGVFFLTAILLAIVVDSYWWVVFIQGILCVFMLNVALLPGQTNSYADMLSTKNLFIVDSDSHWNWNSGSGSLQTWSIVLPYGMGAAKMQSLVHASMQLCL